MNIEGKIVTLRAIELNDLELLAQWANSAEIWYNLGGFHFPYSRQSTESYIRNIDNSSMKRQVFAIEANDIGLIGTTNLVDIDWKNRDAFHGIMLGNIDTRGKGYALDVEMTIMRYAFKELGLNRLSADIIDYNKSSLGLSKKCGWNVEGKKIEAVYRNGEYHDQYLVGITHKQYDKYMETNGYWET